MYWRVRKISPEQVAKTYGIHAVCVVSVLCNLVLFSKVAPAKGLTTAQKTDTDTFVRKVTQHILDGCFVTYDSSMMQLCFNGAKSELTGPAIQTLVQMDEVIPRNMDNMRAVSRQLKEGKSVSQVAIDDVKIDDPNSQGYVPVEVGGRVVKHSAEGLMGPNGFRFKYLVGTAKKGDTEWPVVVGFQDISGQAPAPQ